MRTLLRIALLLGLVAISVPAHAEVKRLEIPECWYGEARLDGQWACLKANQYIQTSFGRVELPRYIENGREIADNVLFLRITPNGTFKMAGQSHSGKGNWEWAGGLWRIAGPSYGVNPVIYDWLNVLAFGAPQFGSQGFRYATHTNQLITGDATYSDPAQRIWEFTTYGDTTVGQGEAGCIGIRVADRRMLEPGDCRFVRMTRSANHLANAFVKQVEGKIVFLWLDAEDWPKFPLETQPQPEPIPDPAPKPEPQPQAPDRSADIQRVAGTPRGAELLRINTTQALCEFTQRVLTEINDAEWGHVSKTAGEGQCLPTGFTPRQVNGHTISGVSHDAIFHRASNSQFDIIGNAGANDPCHFENQEECWTPGPANVGWGFVPRQFYRPNNPWIPRVPLTGVDPKPEPEPTPQPDVNALKQRIAQLEALLASEQALSAELRGQVNDAVASATEAVVAREQAIKERDEARAKLAAVQCELTGPGWLRPFVGCRIKP